MCDEGYTKEQVVTMGNKIYRERIKHLVEPQENGKFIAIDILSGDYEVDEEDLDASDRLKARRPTSVRFLAKVGCKAAYRIGWGGSQPYD